MEIGISIYSGIEIESIVKSLKEHGVKRTFLSSEMEDFDNVMSLLNESEIICETLHAPFDTINDMWCKDEEKGNAVLTRLKNAEIFLKRRERGAFQQRILPKNRHRRGKANITIKINSSLRERTKRKLLTRFLLFW